MTETRTLLSRLGERWRRSRGAGDPRPADSRTVEEERGGKREAVDPSAENFQVFFLLGFAKSGTSWLTRTLNSHPEILCRGEGIFFGRGPDLGRRRGLLTPTSLYGALADSENLRRWFEGSIWTKDDDPDQHLNNLSRLAIKYVLGEKLAASGKRIVGDKTPFVTEDCLKEINLLLPEAKVIHIIRDGRDVAVSAMHHAWNHAVDAGGHLSIKPEELAKRDAYRKDPKAFLASGESIFDEGRLREGFVKSWKSMTARAIEQGPDLLNDKYTEVRYEDLLERPEKETGRLFDFLGARTDEKIVRQCVEATNFERISKRKRGEEDSASFLRKGVAGDWKNVFTKRDRQIFKEEAGDLLVRLGYEEDLEW